MMSGIQVSREAQRAAIIALDLGALRSAEKQERAAARLRRLKQLQGN